MGLLLLLGRQGSDWTDVFEGDCAWCVGIVSRSGAMCKPSAALENDNTQIGLVHDPKTHFSYRWSRVPGIAKAGMRNYSIYRPVVFHLPGWWRYKHIFSRRNQVWQYNHHLFSWGFWYIVVNAQAKMFWMFKYTTVLFDHSVSQVTSDVPDRLRAHLITPGLCTASLKVVVGSMILKLG